MICLSPSGSGSDFYHGFKHWGLGDGQDNCAHNVDIELHARLCRYVSLHKVGEPSSPQPQSHARFLLGCFLRHCILKAAPVPRLNKACSAKRLCQGRFPSTSARGDDASPDEHRVIQGVCREQGLGPRQVHGFGDGRDLSFNSCSWSCDLEQMLSLCEPQLWHLLHEDENRTLQSCEGEGQSV